MNPLSIKPIPSVRNEEESTSLQMERVGFVDESVVTAMLASPRITRSVPYPEDLILSVDDMDFAGWQLSPKPQARVAEVPPQVIDAIVRRATPPSIEEPGIGSPHLGSHRWWLAGLAGVLSTMLFFLLLLNLSSRTGDGFEVKAASKPWFGAKPVQIKRAESEPAPANLAESSSGRH